MVEEYQGEPRRWAILFVVTLAETMGSTISTTLQPISVPIAEAFKLKSVIYVNLTIMINMVGYAPMTFLCIYLYSHFKTSTVLRSAITFQMIGATIRGLCYFTDSYWTIVVGSFFCFSVNPFTINV